MKKKREKTPNFLSSTKKNKISVKLPVIINDDNKVSKVLKN